MRAWQVSRAGEPSEVLQLVELPSPEPGPGQLRIRVTAAGIGLPDVLMCRHTYPLTPASAFTPGQEATGVITAVGPGVDREVGSTVMSVTSFTDGHGSFAEECLVPSGSAFAVPDGLTDAQAAGFWIPHLTGWIGLVDRGRLAEGEWLAVLGAAGGSGIAAVQLGRALRARVIAVVSDEDRADFCRRLGADHTLVPGGADLSTRLREMTGGLGVDAVYDPVGGDAAEQACSALGRHGRLLAVGFAGGRWPRIDTHNLVITNTSLVGVFAGGYDRRELDSIHARLAALVSEGHLRNAVTAEVPFAELPAAMQRLADRAVIGKMVMVP
jgi:NADPH2:quinone reductase